MTEMMDLVDEVIAQAAHCSGHSGRPTKVEAHECDGCGEVSPNVRLYAEDSETGEEIWLCVSCGS